MNSSKFSLEFELNVSEIRKLNKMYFKHLYKKRATIFSVIIILGLIFFDFFSLNDEDDFIKWILRNLVLILLFYIFQHPLVNSISKITFRLIKKMVKSDNFARNYKFNFNNSSLQVHSPLGAVAHKWSKIEKAILTKDFFFLYIKDRNRYIISISNKNDDNRNMKSLIAFVESNVTHIIKIE